MIWFDACLPLPIPLVHPFPAPFVDLGFAISLNLTESYLENYNSRIENECLAFPLFHSFISYLHASTYTSNSPRFHAMSVLYCCQDTEYLTFIILKLLFAPSNEKEKENCCEERGHRICRDFPSVIFETDNNLQSSFF